MLLQLALDYVALTNELTLWTDEPIKNPLTGLWRVIEAPHVSNCPLVAHKALYLGNPRFVLRSLSGV